MLALFDDGDNCPGLEGVLVDRNDRVHRVHCHWLAVGCQLRLLVELFTTIATLKGPKISPLRALTANAS